jgi:hypothetical protein
MEVRRRTAEPPGMAAPSRPATPPGTSAPGRIPGRSSLSPMWPSCPLRMSRTAQVQRHRPAAGPGPGRTAGIRTARPKAARPKAARPKAARLSQATRRRRMRPRRVRRAGGSGRPPGRPGSECLRRTSSPMRRAPRRVPDRGRRRAARMSRAGRHGRGRNGKPPPRIRGQGLAVRRPPRARGRIRAAWGWCRRSGRCGGGGRRRASSRNRHRRLGSRRNRDGSSHTGPDPRRR